MMPVPDYRPEVPMTEGQRELLSRVVKRATTLDDVLYGVQVLSEKIDALTAALVKPHSSIILVDEDIARIAVEINQKGQTT